MCRSYPYTVAMIREKGLGYEWGKLSEGPCCILVEGERQSAIAKVSKFLKPCKGGVSILGVGHPPRASKHRQERNTWYGLLSCITAVLVHRTHHTAYCIAFYRVVHTRILALHFRVSRNCNSLRTRHAIIPSPSSLRVQDAHSEKRKTSERRLDLQLTRTGFKLSDRDAILTLRPAAIKYYFIYSISDTILVDVDAVARQREKAHQLITTLLLLHCRTYRQVLVKYGIFNLVTHIRSKSNSKYFSARPRHPEVQLKRGSASSDTARRK